MAILKFENVEKSFCNSGKEIEVLNNIDFEIMEGEIVAITGPSECGKTTILNLISKLITPNKGNVLINGEIGYMFQKDNLLDWRTIYKNITIGLEIKGKITSTQKERIENLLKKYDLYDFRNNYPNELSGGMRQRVG